MVPSSIIFTRYPTDADIRSAVLWETSQFDDRLNNDTAHSILRGVASSEWALSLLRSGKNAEKGFLDRLAVHALALTKIENLPFQYKAIYEEVKRLGSGHIPFDEDFYLTQRKNVEETEESLISAVDEEGCTKIANNVRPAAEELLLFWIRHGKSSAVEAFIAKHGNLWRKASQDDQGLKEIASTAAILRSIRSNEVISIPTEISRYGTATRKSEVLGLPEQIFALLEKGDFVGASLIFQNCADDWENVYRESLISSVIPISEIRLLELICAPVHSAKACINVAGKRFSFMHRDLRDAVFEFAEGSVAALQKLMAGAMLERIPSFRTAKQKYIQALGVASAKIILSASCNIRSSTLARLTNLTVEDAEGVMMQYIVEQQATSGAGITARIDGVLHEYIKESDSNTNHQTARIVEINPSCCGETIIAQLNTKDCNPIFWEKFLAVEAVKIFV